MQTFVQRGKTVTLTPSSAVSAGGGCLFSSSLFGVAASDVASGAPGEFVTDGVVSIAKDTGAVSVGAPLYWNASTKKVTASSVGSRVGTAVAAALSADARVSMLMAQPAVSEDRIALRGRRLRVIFHGDSNVAGSSSSASEIWRFGNSVPEMLALAGATNMRVVRNAGVAGNTTQQMRDRLTTDVLAYAPDVVLLLGGTNDLASGMSTAAIAGMMGNLESMVQQILAAGALPVLFTPPPKNAAAAESRRVQPYYYLLAEHYGIPLVDLYRVLVDPTTGNYNASYSADGAHPNAPGVAAVQAVYGPLMTDLSGFSGQPYLAAYSETAVDQPANLLRNGNFARAASAPTPDGWTVNATGATQTIPAATLPHTGNTFTYVKASGGAAYALSGANVTTGAFAVGDTLRFAGRVTASGLTPASATGFQVALGLNGVSGAANSLRIRNNCPIDGTYLWEHEFVVPAGCTSITPQLYVADNATYTANNWTLVNVSAIRAIWAPGNPT